MTLTLHAEQPSALAAARGARLALALSPEKHGALFAEYRRRYGRFLSPS